jgi:hypothetical protein
MPTFPHSGHFVGLVELVHEVLHFVQSALHFSTSSSLTQAPSSDLHTGHFNVSVELVHTCPQEAQVQVQLLLVMETAPTRSPMRRRHVVDRCMTGVWETNKFMLAFCDWTRRDLHQALMWLSEPALSVFALLGRVRFCCGRRPGAPRPIRARNDCCRR